MFGYKLLNGEGGMFFSDNKEITAKEAGEELRKKHEYLQKEDTKVILVVMGKILDDNAKLKDYELEKICCVHVLLIADNEE